MATGDPYLHSGLSPATDVSLYPSQAQGAGTTYNVSAAVVAASTVSVTKVAAHNVSATVSGVGALSVVKVASHNLSAAVVASSTVSVTKVATHRVSAAVSGVGAVAASRTAALHISAAVVGVGAVAVSSGAAHSVSAAVSGVGAVGVSTAVAHATPKPPYVTGGAGGGRFAVDLVIPALAVDAVAAIKESHTATFDGRRAHEDELVLVGAF